MHDGSPFRRIRLGVAIGVAFLGAQGAAFVWAKFVPTRYFCWAPYDQHTFYRISATREGRELAEVEIGERYMIPARGFNSRSYAEIVHLVDQYEQTYGAGDGIVATVKFKVNGHPERVWTSSGKP
jgi:hypothetical protein